MTDVTNDRIQSLTRTLEKLTDLADAAVEESKKWLDTGGSYRSTIGVSMGERARMIAACADMAAVYLRLAEFHQTTHTQVRYDRQQEMVFERARQAGARDNDTGE